ncbi:hypothetical protein MB901379_03197 [Mycobacterium basiliense]|uniref:Uncharacterized protein n=1 Tax=Mycobacterium basiliense TaxID=2094119 RepID=A0A3S4CXB5_9MYCO|nr:hypothetical protein [Mycobacterium basiliense]VDM89619.1 hypothetical protein MB901379_03197 [Mycobacterium basiliense]
MTCPYVEETWERIEQANNAVDRFPDWTIAERDQMEALADDLNKQLLETEPSRDELLRGIGKSEAPHWQHIFEVDQRAKALGWKRISNTSCPRPLVGKRCKGTLCWCGGMRSGEHGPFGELNDHGATWFDVRRNRQFVLWEPYGARAEYLAELINVAEQEGLQVLHSKRGNCRHPIVKRANLARMRGIESHWLFTRIRQSAGG